MKCKKVDEILPEELLKEVQKYVKGELIYIPCPEGVRKGWGENSGSKTYLRSRNLEIRSQFCEGFSIDQLTMAFCLLTAIY